MKIGILGIKARTTTPWCIHVMTALRQIDPQVDFWTPDDDAWDDINWTSGDAIQPIVDGITRRQIEGIASCTALLVHLDSSDSGLGARLELGRILMTEGLRIHLVLSQNLMGRHYIRSQYPFARATVTEHASLDEAVAAIAA